MNILLCYRWSPYTTAAYYAKAFRALGHDVRTCGPYDEAQWAAWPEAQRYRLTGPHYQGEPGRWNPMHGSYDDDGWWPNVKIWIEAGRGWVGILAPVDWPTMAYFIDSHTHWQEHVKNVPCFDIVFVADIRYVGEYGPNAHWLPMACDPDLHTPTRMEPPDYDVAFVGNTYPGSPLYEDRRQTLAALAKRYKCRFESGVYFQDMANVYASARVVFNKSVLGDLNMRVFEGMCSGRPLVTDLVDGLESLYWRGSGPAFYQLDQEMYMGINAMLSHPDWADGDGDANRENVLAHHTYARRAAQMLQEAGL